MWCVIIVTGWWKGWKTCKETRLGREQRRNTMGWQPGCVLLRGIVLLTFSFHYFVLGSLPSSAKFYTIHWNSSNPIFRIDNTDNIIDVNRNNMKFEYDQVNLICPVYTPGTRDEEMEKYIIYNVSKDEYETCRITNPNPRIIAVCDKPYKLMYFTITFRPFTPQPGGLEFLPGHDYYFISTSTSDDLHRRIGGNTQIAWTIKKFKHLANTNEQSLNVIMCKERL